MRPVTRALPSNSGGSALSILNRSTLLEAAFSNSLVRSNATTLPVLSMAMRPQRASASSR